MVQTRLSKDSVVLSLTIFKELQLLYRLRRIDILGDHKWRILHECSLFIEFIKQLEEKR